MVTWIFQPLLWGMLAVSIPIIIHLINMLRHRRVEWAAMEFLLVSQKKHKTWIVLKQLLLLLMRMLAIAAIVAMVAGPLLRNWLGEMIGTTKTHHIVLIDDSFSMSDRWADKTAFGEAKMVVEKIGKAAAHETHLQNFTLLRFSSAARGLPPDLSEEPVNKTEFLQRLKDKLHEIQVSKLSAGPAKALKEIGQLLGDAKDERRIVYLVSDFRARDWDNPVELRAQLAELNEARAEIHLINCVDETRPNLAITSLAPAAGIRAAGVPWKVEVAVKNFGDTPAKNVPIVLEGETRLSEMIPEIQPGETFRQLFEVQFRAAGPRELTARIDFANYTSDRVETDSYRYHAFDLPLEVPVLLIDGRPDHRDARFLDAALTPGKPVRTGIKPQIETPGYLNRQITEAGKKPLAEFGAILLMNVEALEKPAVTALEDYVRAGGGLAFFMGERCSRKLEFYKEQLYDGGRGLFPLPLVGEAALLVDRLEPAPDLQVEKHPIFNNLIRERNPLLDMVLVQRYFAAPKGWQPEEGSSTRVIVRLRNGAPLMVERPYGDGRVVAFLSTVAPTPIATEDDGSRTPPIVWNNWARNPSFVVAMLDLTTYLAQRSTGDASHQVGTKLELELDGNVYDKQVSFILPDPAAPPMVSDANEIEGNRLAISFAETDSDGVYEVRLAKQGETEIRRYAFNVDAEEGDLKAFSGDDLAERLNGVKYEYRQAASFHYQVSQQAGYNMSDWLLALLVLLLIGEQILAWSTGYHPVKRPEPAMAKGGVR